MMNNLTDIMKQAHAMRKNMAKVQRELKKAEICGESGGGMVRITMNGQNDIRKVEIDPELIGGERKMLEDLIAAAGNDAARKVEAMRKEKMGAMTGGLDLSALNLPF